MEIAIIIIILIVTLITLGIIYKFNMKEIKKFAENKKLDEITSKLPRNVEICKDILKMLKNENVKIEEKSESDTSLYIAISNKIIIANTRNSYTRVQTIAHECLHSIQDRGMLLFNFIYSNIYLVTFAILMVLAILKLLPNKLLFLSIFIILSFVYYFIRSYLEDDAMTKARFLAKDYMNNKKVLTNEEIDELVTEYDKFNNVVIKATNYSLYMNVILKTIVFGIVLLIF